MSLFSTAALFFLASFLLSPAYACLDAGCVDAAVGLGYAAHVGIAIGVVVLVVLVVALIIRQRRKRMQEAQANGTQPYDIEHGVPASQFNPSQTTVITEGTYGARKSLEEVKDY